MQPTPAGSGDELLAGVIFLLIVLLPVLAALRNKARGGTAAQPCQPLTRKGPAVCPPTDDLVARLCRRSRQWLVVARAGNLSHVRNNDHRSLVDIEVKSDRDSPSVLFQAWFSVRFSLERFPVECLGSLPTLSFGRGWRLGRRVRAQTRQARPVPGVPSPGRSAATLSRRRGFPCAIPLFGALEQPPSGLYARLLLRNFDLTYANWGMNIGASSEACLFVTAREPKPVLDARLLHHVCNEIVEEINGMHRELRDKFCYEVDPFSVIRSDRQPPPEVRFIEPGRDALPQGNRRYRLPGR